MVKDNASKVVVCHNLKVLILKLSYIANLTLEVPKKLQSSVNVGV